MSRRTLLGAIALPRLGAGQPLKERGTQLVVRDLKLFPAPSSGDVQIIAYVNATRLDMTAGHPLKVGPFERNLAVAIPDAAVYFLRFELFVTDADTRMVLGAKEQEVRPAPPSPHSSTDAGDTSIRSAYRYGSQSIVRVTASSEGLYKLYQIANETRSAGVSAEISYAVVKLD